MILPAPRPKVVSKLSASVVRPSAVAAFPVESGIWSNGRLGGLFQTGGVGIGYGAGAYFLWATSSGVSAFGGPSIGGCVGAFFLAVCRTTNAAGVTWSGALGVGTRYGVFAVRQETEIIEVIPCLRVMK